MPIGKPDRLYLAGADGLQPVLIAQRALSDKHRQLLSRLQPLQITPLRKQGMEDPVWGVPLSLK